MLTPNKVTLLVSALMLVTALNGAYAQHPSEVQKLTAEGDYMAALALFTKLPKRRATTLSYAAAAKSAWGLSLNDLAEKYYDEAISRSSIDKQLSQVDRARIFLSKAMINFQGNRFDLAIENAKRASKLLPTAGPLRAEVHQLWADSLFELNRIAPAEEHYKIALLEGSELDKGELHFKLARVLRKLGQLSQATYEYQSVPVAHPRSAQAIRELISLSLEQSQSEAALMWIAKGRELFPDQFADSWLSFIQGSALAQLGHTKELRSLRSEAEQNFAPSDHYRLLLEASSECFEWKSLKTKQSGILNDQ